MPMESIFAHAAVQGAIIVLMVAFCTFVTALLTKWSNKLSALQVASDRQELSQKMTSAEQSVAIAEVGRTAKQTEGLVNSQRAELIKEIEVLKGKVEAATLAATMAASQMAEQALRTQHELADKNAQIALLTPLVAVVPQMLAPLETKQLP